MEPKVVDAARVTTPIDLVWRNCTGCDRHRLMTDGADRCDLCAGIAPRPAAEVGWDLANQLARLVGAIEGWADDLSDVTDAEKLAKIRHLLSTRNPYRRETEVR
ncbi:hypothetical protein [Actinoplanes couchii]|uniref:Uncharacterized protein n=1 Tax=Actinoplanes couchii TaxID=403638 RepID=A0ABQ3XQ49_9ACTN|nr:hypothetical protein [Actinoplanes couchii]MDR6322972.1 hypothetical protein [Actinoplanes couchii]GID60646.1 hypothetical protein Aco03nite_090500 [Actinoplanes couchii]